MGLTPVSFFVGFSQQWSNTRAILIWSIRLGTCDAKFRHALVTSHTSIPNSTSASDETLYSREE